MYRSMNELTTRCTHAHLRWVIAAVARVMPGTCRTNPSLHIAGSGHGQSFDGFIARWI
jgi:hypothetical protein